MTRSEEQAAGMVTNRVQVKRDTPGLKQSQTEHATSTSLGHQSHECLAMPLVPLHSRH